MQTVTTIGLDLAKSVFQVHGVDAPGQVVIRRKVKRRYVLAFFQKLPPCLIGIEACSSSHYWSRELKALGHTVRLMPPAYSEPSTYGTRRKSRHVSLPSVIGGAPENIGSFRALPPLDPQQKSGLPSGRPPDKQRNGEVLIPDCARQTRRGPT